MPAERLSMRKISEILRLKWEQGLSNRKIAQSCAVSRSAVSDYLQRAEAAGLSWPLPAELEEEQLEALLFSLSMGRSPTARPEPDWSALQQESKKKGVTLALLWQEYKAAHPDGWQYSFFCEQYRRWLQTVEPVMRQCYQAGEKLFVDYCGQTLSVINRDTGELREVQIFTAVLGASNYTYAEATWTQSLPDWIDSHVRAFAFFGGVVEEIIPDNLKSGVHSPCRYEPDLNPTYQDFAHHYQVAVLPARVRKPRDKAKVETGVQIVERWILAPLRHHQFFSLREVNQAVQERLKELNQRPFQKLPGCRQSQFEELERPALKPLPTEPYIYAEWKKARVNVDYHVEVERHYYSVPYRLIRKQLDVRITAHTVECFHKGKRVGSHVRSHTPGSFSTQKEHMPKSHQEYLDWTPERLLHQAEAVGPHTKTLLHTILQSRSYPAQGFRSGLGILRLAKQYGNERLEQASQRALAIGAHSYKSVCSILSTGLDQRPLPEPVEPPPPQEHENLRGDTYFQ